MYTLNQILNDPDATGTWHGPHGESVTYHEVGDYWSWVIDGRRGMHDDPEAVRNTLEAARSARLPRTAPQSLEAWIDRHTPVIREWGPASGEVGVCWVVDCDRSPARHGLCRTHYKRAYRGWKRATEPGANVPGDNPKENDR